MGKPKLKGAELILTLTVVGVGGFVLGWYCKKGQYRIKRWWNGEEQKQESDNEEEKTE